MYSCSQHKIPTLMGSRMSFSPATFATLTKICRLYETHSHIRVIVMCFELLIWWSFALVPWSALGMWWLDKDIDSTLMHCWIHFLQVNLFAWVLPVSYSIWWHQLLIKDFLENLYKYFHFVAENWKMLLQEPCLLSHVRIYNKSVLEWEISVGLRYKVGIGCAYHDMLNY